MSKFAKMIVWSLVIAPIYTVITGPLLFFLTGDGFLMICFNIHAQVILAGLASLGLLTDLMEGGSEIKWYVAIAIVNVLVVFVLIWLSHLLLKYLQKSHSMVRYGVMTIFIFFYLSAPILFLVIEDATR